MKNLWFEIVGLIGDLLFGLVLRLKSAEYNRTLTDKEKAKAFLNLMKKEADELKPTPIGLQKYDNGYYEDYPCTCTKSCPEYDCKGVCGCGACHAAYSDSLERNEQWERAMDERHG